MTGRVGKPWIDTAKPAEVNEHPHKARAQNFRNGWLKVKNEISARKWTRISMPKTETNSTKERIGRCLSRLSEDLSKRRHKSAALKEISALLMSQGLWDRELDDLPFAETYTANQLQQLRKNCKGLLKGDLSDAQRNFLTATFKRVDSDLVLEKGYSHSSLPEAPVPAPNYVPLPPVAAPRPDAPLPDAPPPVAAPLLDVPLLDVPPPNDHPPPLPDADGFISIDLENDNFKYPEPELQAEEKPTEADLLLEFERDMAAFEAQNIKPASSKFAGGPLPPSDAPPPLPIVAKEPSQTPEAPVEQRPAEVQAGGDPKNTRAIPRRLPKHTRNVTDQTGAKKPMAEKPVRERRNSFDLDQLDKQMDEELKLGDPAKDKPLDEELKLGDPAKDIPRRVPKPITARPRLLSTSAKPNAASTNAKPNAAVENIQGPHSAAPQVTAVPEKNASHDAGHRAARNEQQKRALLGNSGATPLEQRLVPHWLQGISVPDGPPAERAEKGIEALIKTIARADLRSANGARWLFYFLNLLADPALDAHVGAAVASRSPEIRQSKAKTLLYLSSAMHTLAERSEYLGPILTEPKSNRIAAILNLWERIKGPLAVTADPLGPPDYNKLMLRLQSMDLPAPAAPPPAPRALRREWSQNNT